MSVVLECCVLSGRGLNVGLITRPEESYESVVSDRAREASIIGRSWPTASRKRKPNNLGEISCSA